MDIETIGIGIDTTGLDKGAASLAGITDAANKAADAADKLGKKANEGSAASYKLGQSIGQTILAVAGGIQASNMFEKITEYAKLAITATDRLIENVARFQDLAEKTGGSAAGIASMRTAADVAGVGIEAVTFAMTRMNRALLASDDESKGAGRALEALGLKLADIKKQSPDEQLRSVAAAMKEFKDIGGGKSALMQSLTGRGSAEMLIFMKELGDETKRVTYLTNEQVAAADVYSDANKRARSQVSQLAEAASLLALGAFNALQQSIITTIGDMLGLENGADSLAGNTGINDFAVEAVRALGAVITTGQAITRTFQNIGTGLYSMGAAAKAAFKGDFEGARTIIADADKQIKALEAKPLFSQTLQANLAKVGKGQFAIDIAARKAANEKEAAERIEKLKKELKYVGRDGKEDKAGKADVDPLDSILKGIRSRTAGMALELAMGDKLTAGQKQAAEVMDEIRNGTLKLTQAKTLLLTKELESMLAAEAEIASKKRQADMLKAMLDEAQQNRDEMDADLKTRGDAYNSAIMSAQGLLRTARERNDQARFEISLMDVAENKREKMLAQYQLQVEYMTHIAEIDAMNIDPAQRTELKTKAAQTYQTSIDGTSADSVLKSMRELNAYFDPTKAQTFAEALKNSFGAAGNAFAQLSGVFDEYARKQAELNKQTLEAQNLQEGANAAYDGGRIAESLTLQGAANKALANIEKARSKNQIQGYGEMAGAMKGFFKENSTGYKALEVVQATFQVAQAASMLAQGTAAAAVGVATQAQGDPYTAFARMAAMAAAMASLGFAIGGFSGSGGAASTLAADRQAALGKGGVLGASDEKSESINKSLKLIEESSRAGLQYSAHMLTALRSIDTNMAGLAIMLLKSAGITGDYNGPTQMGTQNKSFGWGKNITSLIDKGVEFRMQALSDILMGNLHGQSYADIETTSSSWFGLVKKTSRRREMGAIDPAIEQQFARVIANIVDTTRTATGALGQSAEDFNARMANVQIQLGTLSFKGLTGKQIEEQLAAAFSVISDDIARIALPAVEQFQRIGEGLFETVVRVSVGVETAANSLDLLGIAAINYAQIINKQGDIASEIFRQSVANSEVLAGSSAVISAYLEGVTGGLGDLVDAYKQLITVRNSMVAVGGTFWQPQSLARGAGGLERLQSGLDSYFENFFTTAEKDAARTSQLNQDIAKIHESPIENTAAAFRARLSSIDLSTNEGQVRYGRLVAMSQQFFDVVKAQETAMKQATQAHAEYAKNLRIYRNNLFLNQLSPLDAASKTSVAETMFNSVLEKARGGDLEAQKGLTGASGNYLEALKNSAQSSLDYAIGFAKVQTALTLEAVRADSLAQQQVDYLSSIDATLLTLVGGYDTLGSLPAEERNSLIYELRALREARANDNAANVAIAVHTFETSKAVRELRDLQVQAMP